MADKEILIPLTGGLVTKIDADQAEKVFEHKWHTHTSCELKYAATKINGGRVFLHNFLCSPATGLEVDHINGDGLDNRKVNLRVCTKQQNLKNRRRASHNKSGYKGVYLDKRRRKWRAEINVDGVRHSLGSYKNPIDAAHAYNKAAIKLHGDFAVLNPY